MVLIALVAWVRAPEADEEPEMVTGMWAMVPALFAEALAIGIQINPIFREIGKSERIVTIVVLVVASVQIILTRPRRKSRSLRGHRNIEPERVEEHSGP